MTRRKLWIITTSNKETDKPKTAKIRLRALTTVPLVAKDISTLCFDEALHVDFFLRGMPLLLHSFSRKLIISEMRASTILRRQRFKVQQDLGTVQQIVSLRLYHNFAGL